MGAIFNITSVTVASYCLSKFL